MDLVKEEGFWDIDEEDKKLDFEVYPHMVEQLIWKIKEARERTPKRIAAREDFNELIQRIQKLAKVRVRSGLHGPVSVCYQSVSYKEPFGPWTGRIRGSG